MTKVQQRILETAVRVFAERGFRGTTTKEIATEAAVNETSIFRLYRDKAHLFKEAAKALNASLRPIDDVIADLDSSEFSAAVRRGAEAIADRLTHDAARLETFAALEFRESLPDLIGDRLKMVEAFAKRIRKEQRAGLVRKMPPKPAARALIYAVHAHCLRGYIYAPEDKTLRRANIRQYADLWLHGALVDKPE